MGGSTSATTGRQHQLPRFGEQRLDHRRLLAPASSAGSSLSRGRSSGSPRSPRSSLRCSASTAPTTRRSATTGGRDRAWHRKRAESTLRPVQVAGSGIGHSGPDSSAGRQAGKLGGLPAIVRYSGQERKSLSYNAVHSVRLFIRPQTASTNRCLPSACRGSVDAAPIETPRSPQPPETNRSNRCAGAGSGGEST